MIVDNQLEPLLISGTSTLHEAMERLNSTPHIMQLVIDGAGVLVGTITDGDIRRALLGGRRMDAAVNQCMRETPLVGNSVGEAIALTTNLTGRLRCIPVVDSDGRPWVVVSDAGHSPGLETAMIMPGGFGRRLGGHTANTQTIVAGRGPADLASPYQ